MILILGSSRDDILYFDTIIRNRQTSIILNKFETITGTIFNQNIMIVKDVYTNYASTIVTSYVLGQYDITYVLMVGKCLSFNPDLQNGDIALSKDIIPLDVDQINNISGLVVGQIPGCNRSFNESDKLIETMIKTFDKFSSYKHYQCTYLSSNTYYTNKDMLRNFSNGKQILGMDKLTVMDSESAGAAYVCNIYGIPFLAVKVVQTCLDNEANIDTYVSVLKQYSQLGKCIISFIGEMGRSDMMEN